MAAGRETTVIGIPITPLQQGYAVSTEQKASWYVIRTIPRFQIEFEVRHAITQREFQAMVPFEEKWVQKPRGGWKERKYPLFAGYVFIRLTDKYEFLPLRAAINEAAERMGTAPPILGLIGNGQPARLTTEQVDKFQAASIEKPTEVNLHKAIQVGSDIDIYRGNWSGRKSRVEAITRRGVKALVEVFNSYHLIEIPMRDVRAAW